MEEVKKKRLYLALAFFGFLKFCHICLQKWAIFEMISPGHAMSTKNMVWKGPGTFHSVGKSKGR